jgi:hypothetical protein
MRLGKALTFALGIALVGATVLFVEGNGSEPTRTPRIMARSTVTPRVIVFKGTSQEGAGQLMPAPQISDQAPKGAVAPAQLSAAEASEMLAATGIKITPAMLGSRKPFTLTPATPRSANLATIGFTNVSQGVVGPSGNSQTGFYRLLGPQAGGEHYVELYVPKTALTVGKSYLVDFAVSCDQLATWRVYMPKQGQQIQLPPGSQHLAVIITWEGPAHSAFHLTLSNFNAAWTFYSATVTELP